MTRDLQIRYNFISITGSLIITLFCCIINYYYKWSTTIGLLEAFAVFASYWCTFLCVFQTRFNYIVGAISVIALGILFYQQNLLASMALQIYFLPTLLYGWFRWREDSNTRPVTHIGFDRWLLVYTIIVAISYVVGVIINNSLGGSNTWIDTSIFVFSILAQFLLDNKKLENWVVWIAVDVISAWLYWNQDLKLLAIQMGLFGLNAVWGYFEWSKSMKNTFNTIPNRIYENDKCA